MKYYVEIINGIVANKGTFDTPTLVYDEEQSVYEITKAQYDNAVCGKTTEAELASMV